MKYFIRKTWEDKESQIGEYTNLQEASDNLKPGYTIFNRNGKGLISCTDISNAKGTLVRMNYQKMWEDLKNYYQDILDSINDSIQRGAHGYGIEEGKENVKGILSKMKEVEDDNQEIIREF